MSQLHDDLPPLTKEQKFKVFEEVLHDLQEKKDVEDDKGQKRTATSAFAENLEEEPLHKKSKTDEHEITVPSENVSCRITEMGHIYFFYRPRVNLEKVESINDVQRFFFILKPIRMETRENTVLKNKLVVVGRKMLPPMKRSNLRSNAFWASLEMVTLDITDITNQLGAQAYDTITRGERKVEEARAVGEGLYALVRNNDNSIGLAYVLELPNEIGDVQEAFNIQKEAAYQLSVKNPNPEAYDQQVVSINATFTTGSANQNVAPSEREIKLPTHLQDQFKSTKIQGKQRIFIPLRDMEFLDYEGLEILMTCTSHDLTKQLGTTGQIIEEEAEREASVGEFDGVELMYKELHLASKNHPVAALCGKWQ